MLDASTYTVLLLDDDPDVIVSLSALLESEENCELLVFSSTSEAIEAVEHHEIDLAVTDYLMPGAMDGIEFLKELRQKQPYSIRIILTAYADKENAIKAINEVGLFKYLEKPWDNDELLGVIREALVKRSLLKQLVEQFGENMLPMETAQP